MKCHGKNAANAVNVCSGGVATRCKETALLVQRLENACLVKDVKIAFAALLKGDAVLLQQELRNTTAHRVTLRQEVGERTEWGGGIVRKWRVETSWNKISKYFPKREELSFLRVLAFPKASKRGLVCSRDSKETQRKEGKRNRYSAGLLNSRRQLEDKDSPDYP